MTRTWARFLSARAIENVTKDLKALVVTELPYQVNKATLFKRIAELVENKVISDIDIGSDRTRDESDRDGMRMVIGLKRGAHSLRSCLISFTSTLSCRKASP